MYRSTLLLLFIMVISEQGFSQSDYVIIHKIIIVGNQKTNKEVILREMDFSEQDTFILSELPAILDNNEKRILSTGLFTSADLNIKYWEEEINRIDIVVTVKEGWYLYPYVIFELADRNFNVWANDFNYSLQRVNYGIALTHINFSGNKDKLKAKLQFGYTGKYELFYEFPYFMNGWGFSANVLYSYNKEISYKTVNNRPLFYKSPDERNLFNQFRFAISLSNRQNAFIFHNFRLQYFNGNVDTLISNRLNSDFFLNSTSRLGYFRFEYDFTLNKLLYPLYPQGGYRWNVNFKKDGFGESKEINNTQLSLQFDKHWSYNARWIFSTIWKVKGNIQRNKIPYFSNQALGFNKDGITGYQLYVVDGTDFLYSKNSIKYKLFYKTFHFQKWLPKKLKTFNTQIFLRTNFDAGYVHEPFFADQNHLANSFLIGYGPAVDIIFLHNFLFSCDFSINRQGETGFFFSGGFQF